MDDRIVLAKAAFKRGFQSGLLSGFSGALFLVYIFRWLTRSKLSTDSKPSTERAASRAPECCRRPQFCIGP
jgi:hypothetical protein